MPDCESVRVYSPRDGVPFKHPVIELAAPAVVPEVVPICPVVLAPLWLEGFAPGVSVWLDGVVLVEDGVVLVEGADVPIWPVGLVPVVELVPGVVPVWPDGFVPVVGEVEVVPV